MNIGARLVSTALSWLKGLAASVLRLFNLAGGGTLPLKWLSENWIQLLIVLLVIGVVADYWVWLLRWRPHWAWFRRKRIVVNDARLVAEIDDGAITTEYVPEEEEGPRVQYEVDRGKVFSDPKSVRPDRNGVDNQTMPKRAGRAARRQTRETGDVFEVGNGDAMPAGYTPEPLEKDDFFDISE